MTEPNGWTEWSKYVLKELERLSNEVSHCHSKLGEIKVEITSMQSKMHTISGVWGAIGAMIPICISLAIIFIKQATG